MHSAAILKRTKPTGDAHRSANQKNGNKTPYCRDTRESRTLYLNASTRCQPTKELLTSIRRDDTLPSTLQPDSQHALRYCTLPFTARLSQLHTFRNALYNTIATFRRYDARHRRPPRLQLRSVTASPDTDDYLVYSYSYATPLRHQTDDYLVYYCTIQLHI